MRRLNKGRVQKVYCIQHKVYCIQSTAGKESRTRFRARCVGFTYGFDGAKVPLWLRTGAGTRKAGCTLKRS